MSIDQDRIELRLKLEELVGVSGAGILMDRPPGGWGDLVTNHTLDLRFAAFEERIDRRIDGLEHKIDRFEDKIDQSRLEILVEMHRRLRAQTWMTITTFTALAGVIVAAIRL